MGSDKKEMNFLSDHFFAGLNLDLKERMDYGIFNWIAHIAHIAV